MVVALLVGGGAAGLAATGSQTGATPSASSQSSSPTGGPTQSGGPTGGVEEPGSTSSPDPTAPPDHASDPSPDPTAEPSPSKEDVVYQVVLGDTLAQISSEFGVSVDQLVAFNGIEDRNLIFAGSALRIPYSEIP